MESLEGRLGGKGMNPATPAFHKCHLPFCLVTPFQRLLPVACLSNKK